MLGMLYLTGLRVPRDQAQAMMWFSRSVAQCNQYVQFSIEHQNTLRVALQTSCENFSNNLQKRNGA